MLHSGGTYLGSAHVPRVFAEVEFKSNETIW